MNFCVILPVHNRLDLTKHSLEELQFCIANTERASFNIILIDDGSTDGTADWVKGNFPSVIILNGDGDLWWSGAVNKGVKYAIDILDTDYVVLWNNDIHVEKNFFSVMLGILLESNNTGIIGSKILVAEEDGIIWSMGGFFNPVTGAYGMYSNFKMDSNQDSFVKEVDWLPGMGTIIPTSIIKAIGYWDNVNFPQYHGDSDFTYRAKLRGYSVSVHPLLVIRNSIKSSGIVHHGNFKQLIRLLTDIRSKSNLRKNLKFYQLYARSLWAYFPLIWVYIRLFGGFFKWKLLGIAGFKPKQ